MKLESADNTLAKMKIKHKSLSQQEAYLKARAYCAYQERSQQEVKSKLLEWGLNKELCEAVVVSLIEADFLNEARFALQYAGGKFRIKKWGRLKIKQGLKLKGVSEYCIKNALASIDSDAYTLTLTKLIKKKASELGKKNESQFQNKIAASMLSKGYESTCIWDILRREFS
jgi:regulatory protein